ncbi:MBL fold metallo-hydrolase [Candidatus Protochlamydia sp. R18]|uniref:MBL fold metallo-hydrolase n=1 Tax=Candidatus Protochlamydia sp. R18 TaxID=1353977 RepID=UPI0005A73E5C|nr:MBL fold metallo-hydrolase [Candidatus Protochlamydia sp. R18]
MSSNHFDGNYYFNPFNFSTHSFWQVLKWMITRKPVKWPESVSVNQQKKLKERVSSDELEVTYVTHSTVLIQIDGKNILTDPIWSERASPFSYIGPKRVSLPGIQFKDLPPIDFVLISHNHYDHMDMPTLQKLQVDYSPVFYVPMGNQKFLRSKGLKKVLEMDWWDEVSLYSSNQLIFVPAQHFSARGLFDRNRTLWGGFMIKTSNQSVYFAGDSGYGPHFKAIRSRLGAPTLACLPIGAYEPRWIMQSIHLSPAEALQAHLDLNAKQSLAIHFGTFQLTDEGIKEPVKILRQEMQTKQIPFEQFWVLNPGECKQIY